jgi:hypothetical protein
MTAALGLFQMFSPAKGRSGLSQTGPGPGRPSVNGRPGLAGYLGSTSVKMSVSPMPVRAMALFRPSVQTG